MIPPEASVCVGAVDEPDKGGVPWSAQDVGAEAAAWLVDSDPVVLIATERVVIAAVVFVQAGSRREGEGNGSWCDETRTCGENSSGCGALVLVRPIAQGRGVAIRVLVREPGRERC